MQQNSKKNFYIIDKQHNIQSNLFNEQNNKEQFCPLQQFDKKQEQNEYSSCNFYQIDNCCQYQSQNKEKEQSKLEQKFIQKSFSNSFSIMKNYFDLQQQSLALKNSNKILQQSKKLLKISKNQALLQQSKIKAQHDLIIKQKIEIITELNLEIQLPLKSSTEFNNYPQNQFYKKDTKIGTQVSSSFQLQSENFYSASKLTNQNMAQSSFCCQNNNNKITSLDLLSSIKRLIQKNQFLNKALEKQEKQQINNVQSSNSLQCRYDQNKQVLLHLTKIKKDLFKKVAQLKKKKLQVTTSFTSSLNENQLHQIIKKLPLTVQNSQVKNEGYEKQMLDDVLNFINEEQSKIVNLNLKTYNNQPKQLKQINKNNKVTNILFDNNTITKDQNLNNYSHSDLKDDLKQEIHVVKLKQNLQQLIQKRNKQQRINQKLKAKYEKDSKIIQNMKEYIFKIKDKPKDNQNNVNIAEIKQKLKSNFLNLKQRIKIKSQVY